jgi:sugar phosphate isomerase/epimerase
MVTMKDVAWIFMYILRAMNRDRRAGARHWGLGLIVPVQDPTPFSPFSPAEWPGSLVAVAEAGYTAAELALTDPAPLESEELARAFASARLRFSSITTGQAATKEGLSLSSPDEGVRRRAVERIQAHVRLAARFEAVVIVGLLCGVTGNPDLLVESLRECARSGPAVRLALEPLNRNESGLLNTVADALTVVHQVGEENLGLLFDTFHAQIEEPDIGDAIRAAGDRLFHVHLADSNRWPPGHGHFDFAPVWDALEAIGYRGNLVLECFVKPDPPAWLAAGKWIQASWSTER